MNMPPTRAKVFSILNNLLVPDSTSTPWNLICIISLIILNHFSSHLQSVPKVRLFESRICDDFYRTHSLPLQIDESMCKKPEIQKELSTVLGFLTLFNAVPRILISVYFGAYADRHGRKPVCIIAFLGYLLSLLWILGVCYFELPIRVVWVSAVFYFIGGGNQVIWSMLFSLISDTVHPDAKTRTLLFVTATGSIASILAPPAAEAMLGHSTWLPYQVVLFIDAGMLVLIFTLPSGKVSLKSHGKPAVETPLLEEEAENEIPGPTSNTTRSHYSATAKHSGRKSTSLSISLSKLFTTPLLICYSIFFLKRIAFSSLDFVYQYVSRHFNWPLRYTTRLQLWRAIGMFSWILVILPTISTLLIRYKIITAERVDIYVLRASSISAAIGTFLIWLSISTTTLYPAMVIWGFGEGIEPVAQGLCAFFVDNAYTGRMFTTITTINGLAELIGGPTMSSLVLIIRDGVIVSEGLCFFVSGVLFFLVTILGYMLHGKSQKEPLEPEDIDNEGIDEGRNNDHTSETESLN